MSIQNPYQNPAPSGTVDSPVRLRPVEWALLLTAPLLAFWLMNFHSRHHYEPGMLDPYLYAGYIHNFRDLFDRYGMTYYAVRFGLILPQKVLVEALGVDAGYLLLRYLLALLTAIPFYALVKKHLQTPVAAVSTALLLTSPYLATTLLWDHPDATGMPFLTAAACLFLLDFQHRWRWDMAAGVCAGMAINSNFFTVAPIGIFLLAHTALWVLARRGVGRIALRLLCVLGAAAALTGAGVLIYWKWLGQWNIFEPTSAITRWLANGGARVWRTPGYAWMAERYHVLAPAVLTVLAPLAWGWRRPDRGEAAIWLPAAGLGAFYYIHQFVMGSNTLQLPYYFSYAVPAVFLLLAATFHGIAGRLEGSWKWICAGMLGAGGILPWILYSYGVKAALFASPKRCAALALATAAGLVVTGALARMSLRRVAAAAVSLLLGVLMVSSFSTIYPGAIRPRGSEANPEQDVYRVALRFIRAIPPLKARPGAIRFWYSSLPVGNALNSIQSTYLWAFSKVQEKGAGMPLLEDAEMKLLTAPDLKWLVVMADRKEQLEAGLDALTRRGITYRAGPLEKIESGGCHVLFRQLELIRP